MDIFASNGDRLFYLKSLKEYGEKFGLQFKAYCLMNNHTHLVVIPETEEALAGAIGRAHQDYTRMYNSRSHTKGFLFQGRFFSCPLGPAHSVAAIAYVERNPVHARMVDNAWDYPWSSARLHVGLEHEDILVKDPNPLEGVLDWRDFLTTDPKQAAEIRKNSRTGRPCGNKSFIAQAENITGRILTPGKAGRHKKAAIGRQEISVMSPD